MLHTIHGGVSLLGTGIRSRKAGSEVILVKAISSVVTKRDGLRFTKVVITCSGNMIGFRVPHGDAPNIKALVTDLALGKHESQAAPAPASTPPSSSIADELSKIAELRRTGVLTDAEFEQQKRKLFGHETDGTSGDQSV
jgi:putative oligomerization/nucleic acid binding protein